MQPVDLHLLGFSTVPPPGTMGGNTRILLEFARRWQADPNVHVTLYIGEGARATCLANGLDERIAYRTIPTGLDSNFYSPLAHLQVLLAGQRLIRGVAGHAAAGYPVCYSGSDFWPDVWTGWRLARQLRGLWIASLYLFAYFIGSLYTQTDFLTFTVS